MRIIVRCCLSLIVVFGLCSVVHGQASSTNYTLVSGSFVTSSGTMSSSTGTVTGIIPSSVASTSSSSTYTAISGAIGVIYTTPSFTAAYAGSATQIVTPADQLLQVGYAGELGTATGTFHYRQMGASSYSSAAMTPGTGDVLEYTCPASLLDISGMEYYFEVSRGISTTLVGRAADPLVFRVELTNAEAQRPAATPVRSYRMVSLPLAPAAATVSAVFGDDLGTYNREVWRLARYNPATGAYVEYPNAGNVAPGTAYWLITDAAQRYGSAGTSVRPNRTSADSSHYTVALQEGWNQLANPFPFNVNWSDVIFNDNGTVLDHGNLDGVIEDAAYLYNGSSYSTTTSVPAWGGVFVNVLKAGVTAMFECRDNGTAIAKPVEGVMASGQSPQWQVELSLSVGDKGDIANYAGVHTEASDVVDKFDFSEPPTAPEGVMLAFKPSGTEGRLLRADYRPEFLNGATWDVVFSDGNDRKLTVSGIDRIPDGMQAWLLTDKATTIQLREGEQLTLANDVKSAQLVIGNDSYLTGQISELLPKEFALNQNFPNPFNPSTTIRFALPKASQVELAVYNTLGQKVATVVDGQMEAGNHAVVWDGRNSGNQQVASGVYFYRLQAGSYNQTKKMMLLK